jgi:hypothetical protein
MQDILDHADALAKKFVDYEPAPEDEVDVAGYRLRRAALARARSERQTAEAVGEARRAGLSWRKIGAELGISAQGAQQRYGDDLSGTPERRSRASGRGGTRVATGSSSQPKKVVARKKAVRS